MADAPIRWTGTQLLGYEDVGPIDVGACNTPTATVDNATAKERECCLLVIHGYTIAPTLNMTLEVYLLYAVDGVNFEDGGASVAPMCQMVGSVPVRAHAGVGADGQRLILKGIPLRPFPFKIVIKNNTDQPAVGVAWDLFSYSEAQIET
jgi:hypothetical protein